MVYLITNLIGYLRKQVYSNITNNKPLMKVVYSNKWGKKIEKYITVLDKELK